LRKQGFARTRGPDEEDIALFQLHVVLLEAGVARDTLVVIVYGYRQRLLGQLLADDVLVEYFLYLVRLGQVSEIFLYAVGFQSSDTISLQSSMHSSQI